MKFKVDENLPVEIAHDLTVAGHDATTVIGERLGGSSDHQISAICQHEERTLITLDMGFADIRAYRPEEHPGITVLRVRRQDRDHLVAVFRPVLGLLEREQLAQRLWIVQEGQLRIHGGEDEPA